MNVPCPYCNRGCAECHDGNAPCVHCDLPAAGVLDDDPMCQSHLDEHACGFCGEKHPDEEHGIVMRERAEDERERRKEVAC